MVRAKGGERQLYVDLCDDSVCPIMRHLRLPTATLLAPGTSRAPSDLAACTATAISTSA